MKYFICKGDRTNSGGIVLEGSDYNLIMGRPISCVGMKVECCNSVQKITQGWNGNLILGQPIAYHGCLLSCGCALISSQNLLGWTNQKNENHTKPEQVRIDPQKYHAFFTLVTEDGDLVVNQMYRLVAEDGTYVEGYSNTEGKTQYLWTHEKQKVSLVLLNNND